MHIVHPRQGEIMNEIIYTLTILSIGYWIGRFRSWYGPLIKFKKDTHVCQFNRSMDYTCSVCGKEIKREFTAEANTTLDKKD